MNSITMDGCKKTSVVFESLLSQVEIINCQSAQVQVSYLFLFYYLENMRTESLLKCPSLFCMRFYFSYVIVFILISGA